MIFLAYVARFLLGVVFVSSGTAKARSLEDFETAVLNYELLPANTAVAVARILPAGEIILGALLLLGIAIGPVALLLSALLCVFILAVSVNLLRGRQIECGCAGSAPSTISWTHVAVNIVLVAVAVFTAAASPINDAIWLDWRWLTETSTTASLLPTVLFAALLLGLYRLITNALRALTGRSLNS